MHPPPVERERRDRVVVVGPGAMGMLFAAKFAGAGLSVALLDHRPERAKRLARDGVTLIDPGAAAVTHAIPCTADHRELPPADWVLLAVKSYDTERALARALPALAADGVLVSLQNGVRHVDCIRGHLPAVRTVFGATGHGATRIDTGRVRHLGEGETLIAAEEQNRERAFAFADLLSRAGIAASCDDDLRFILWRKLLFNAAINPVTALLGIRNGQVPRIGGAWNSAVACFREAREVAGFVIGPEIGQVTEEDLREVCERTAENVSSMLQDLRNGKRTEIHALNGVVVEEARRHDRDASINRSVLELVTALEEARR